ncbi:MAG: tRNA (adenosine(37)-N6)-threonylcarbamoyltransferase complex ATPase subunit type 1 TsaE [Owenweeksia sp.]|nr:tRNA (adenosine(37)-N6)-threonylcarbamoyltransferase complex ATPase subunit type 1 TsaE [Owenweeksia sp.]
MQNKRTAALEQIPSVAQWVLATSVYDILLLQGAMGSGKTTLIKAMARSLGVEN